MNRFVKLRVSTHGIRIINQRGIDRVVRELLAEGVKL